MTRIAIYARYSDPKQNARSPEDQIRLCRERASGEVVGTYIDAAISGSHTVTRQRYQDMMTDARAGKFEIIMAESLDRLTRDLEDIAALYKRLTFIGIKIVTLEEGDVTEMHIGFKGTMNAYFLKSLAAKTKRGQRGNIENGLSAGSLPYGYRKIIKTNDRGDPVNGLREFHPEQADIVRRIFREYISGKSARDIAIDLNRDRIPSPRGGSWNASTIGGSKSRKSGILNNEIYIGRMTYNRQSFSKHPETGRRMPKINPEKDWITKHVPALQIINDRTWEQARRVKEGYSHLSTTHSRRPTYPLSGLMACGCCMGSLVSKGVGRIQCSNYRERGTCDNRKSFSLSTIEGVVFDALKSRLSCPDMLREFSAAFYQEIEREKKAYQASAHDHEKRLRENQKQIDGILKAVEDGMYHPALKERLTTLEREKEGICAAMLRKPYSVVELQPSMGDMYRGKIEGLTDVLRGSDRQEAINILRSIVHSVIVTPTADGMDIELQGKLRQIIDFLAGEPDVHHQPQVLGYPMVAREGFGRKPQIVDEPLFSIKIQKIRK